jgi:2-oxoglutarate dehydrogenase E1 component
MDSYSFLGNAHPEAIEDAYRRYQADPTSVENSWARFFEGFEFATKNYPEGELPENLQKEFQVVNLINLYRSTGHLFTKTNPVRERRKYTPTLDDIHLLGLAESDMDTVFQAGKEVGLGPSKLRDIIQFLKQTYCNTIGVEYMYIRNTRILNWLKEKMESTRNRPQLSLKEKTRLLEKISKAVVFEQFLHTKFVGQKRFSLEGAEALIPALDAVIEKGANLGIEEFVLGMAHRGRLNVLANILNKTYEDIFSEFEGKEYEDALFDGDVKYHLGYSTNIITEEGKKVHLSLTPNPSHLEAVGPVVEGISRAKIDQKYDGDSKRLAAILIHGDAAIAAQGVVYEVIQMSKLEGFNTGGTIHLVINNQVGFTTNYHDARSSTYCTDIAKVVLSPVFHVNGDDVEALVYSIRLAMEFRQNFKRDVFIDLLCYRKYGHNEGDEPRFTQPLLYKAIAAHPNPREIYFKQLLAEKTVDENAAKQLDKEYKQLLQERLDEAKQIRKSKITSFLEGAWKGIRLPKPEDFEESVDTSVDENTLKTLATKITEIPSGKKFFNKIESILKDRQKMIQGDGQLDWAMGELLAYATLLNAGHHVRFSGQDVERGTFSHRHAVIKIEDSEEEYVPLRNLKSEQGEFHIYNSHLSEYGVLGFEYGYAMASPYGLTIWEAQFGDFSNCAQVIIDQYLSSAEDKWRRMNNICLLLPHGYEGQGAEHSSARMERFLALCAANNMYVVNCTTPGNFFHVLRRQVVGEIRKPLVVFSPKSLLRHPKCVSSFKELSQSRFKELIDDAGADSSKVESVVLCTGKIYYELEERKQQDKLEHIAIVRLEQLYPFPMKQFRALMENKYKGSKQLYWIQEEPENMGAWSYILRTLRSFQPEVIARPLSASPATGSYKQHYKQQADIMDKLAAIPSEKPGKKSSTTKTVKS